MATLASDTYTRADGAIGTAEVGGTYTIAPAGGGGAFVVSSNKAKCSAVDPASFTNVEWLDPGTAEVTISYDVSYVTGTDVGLVTRVTPHTGASDVNYILCSVSAGVLKLYHCVNSVYTQVGSNGGSVSNGNTYNVKMVVIGNVHNVYLDGSLVIGPQTITQHAGITKAGFVVFNETTTLWDNFLIETSLVDHIPPQSNLYRM